MPVLVTAEHCSSPMAAVVRSYAGSAQALLRHYVSLCSLQGRGVTIVIKSDGQYQRLTQNIMYYDSMIVSLLVSMVERVSFGLSDH